MRAAVLSAMAALTAILLGAAPSPAPQSREVRFPTFGLRLTPPSGATFSPPSKPGHIAYYQLASPGDGKPMAILIEAEPKVDKSASAVAEQFVKQGATVLRTIKVSGEDGVELSAPANAGGFTQRVSCIVVHDRREYVFSIFSGGENDGAGTLEQMLSTVDLRPPESPVDHLDETFEKPLNILDALAIQAPACLRPYAATAQHLMLGAHDFLVGDAAFFVDFAIIKAPAGATFDGIRESYSQQIKKNLKVADELVWTTTSAQPRLHISQAQPATIATPGGDVHLVVRYCLMELPDGRIMQIYFSIPDRAPSAVKAYVELSDKMLASVRLPHDQASAGAADGK